MKDISEVVSALPAEKVKTSIEKVRKPFTPAKVEVYYDSGSKSYFLEDDRNQWISLNEQSVKRFLKSKGFSSKGDNSPLDRQLLDIQLKQNISYAAPLAGYSAGLYEINNRRILVTDSPRFIEAKAGEWPLLKSIMEGMFVDSVQDQTPYVYGWLKVAIRAMKQRKWQPGQILALAGPVRSAKSLFQCLVTAMLGGRVAHPYQYMSGATSFNADLFGAEHLAIEDVAESTDIGSRREFGANGKAFAVNRDQHCHGKNVQALTLTPFWRVTVSLNDDPERLLVLPPLDDDIADKVILLKVHRQGMPMPTEDADQQLSFWNALIAELPAFLAYLEEWEIPNELRSPRFGITHYHHPELMLALEAHSPEQMLLELIDKNLDFFGSKNDGIWEGSASRLTEELNRVGTSTSKQVDKLLRYASSCGSYLTRLVKKRPERVSVRVLDGKSLYSITKPPKRPND